MKRGAHLRLIDRPAVSRVLVTAEASPIRRRIAAVLAADGLEPMVLEGEAHLRERVAALAGEDQGEVEVLVLACDVSRAQGMATLRRVAKAARRAMTVVVSPPTDGTGLRRALDAGADGVVFELELEFALAASVRAVAAGQSAVPRKLRRGVRKPVFSHREREVLRLASTGLNNAQIAKRLYLSESTVKHHLSSAFAQLGVRSRKEAAALVLESDIGLDVRVAGSPGPALTGT